MHAFPNEVALKSSAILYSCTTFSNEISYKIKLVSLEMKLTKAFYKRKTEKNHETQV